MHTTVPVMGAFCLLEAQLRV